MADTTFVNASTLSDAEWFNHVNDFVYGGVFPSSINVYIGDTANANMTLGLTINQGANDNEILGLKSSDIAHGMTDIRETDTYGGSAKWVAANGGIFIYGLSAGTVGMSLSGYHTTDTADRTTAATGAVMINGLLKSGSSAGGLGADANILVIRTGTTARFIYDAEGSAFADVEWTTFDRFDDLAVIEDMETLLAPGAVERAFGDVVKHDAAFFAREGLLHDVRDVGGGRMRGMLNTTRAHMVEMGAIRQLGKEIIALKGQLLRLENRNA